MKFINKIFYKALIFIIFFLIISIILQDNFILWGISAGMFVSLINFFLLCLLCEKILNVKKRFYRMLYIVILPFKLIMISCVLAFLMVFTGVHWAGILIGINFIICLIIWETITEKIEFSFGRVNNARNP